MKLNFELDLPGDLDALRAVILALTPPASVVAPVTLAAAPAPEPDEDPEPATKGRPARKLKVKETTEAAPEAPAAPDPVIPAAPAPVAPIPAPVTDIKLLLAPPPAPVASVDPASVDPADPAPAVPKSTPAPIGVELGVLRVALKEYVARHGQVGTKEGMVKAKELLAEFGAESVSEVFTLDAQEQHRFLARCKE